MSCDYRAGDEKDFQELMRRVLLFSESMRRMRKRNYRFADIFLKELGVIKNKKLSE